MPFGVPPFRSATVSTTTGCVPTPISGSRGANSRRRIGASSSAPRARSTVSTAAIAKSFQDVAAAESGRIEVPDVPEQPRERDEVLEARSLSPCADLFANTEGARGSGARRGDYQLGDEDGEHERFTTHDAAGGPWGLTEFTWPHD
jgi:hypothetical protein